MKNCEPDVPAGSSPVLAIATMPFVYFRSRRRGLLDRVAGAAVAVARRVAALDHEVRDDAVERRAVEELLVGQVLERAAGDRRVLGVERDLDVPAGRRDRRDVGLGLAQLLGRLLERLDLLGRGLLDVLAALRGGTRWRRRGVAVSVAAASGVEVAVCSPSLESPQPAMTRAKQAMRTARSRGTAGKDNAATCHLAPESVPTTTSSSTSTVASGSETRPFRARRKPSPRSAKRARSSCS